MLNFSHKKSLSIITICLFCFGFSLIPTGASDSTKNLLEDERNTISVFKKASPYVVYVHNLKRMVDLFYDVFEVRAGTGSGVLWDKQGHIVTNYHVIKGASDIVVTLNGGKTSKAKLIGAEPHKDIAVLKLINPPALPAFEHKTSFQLADSSNLDVGQKIIAIGNPYGLDRTLTTGIISATGRRVPGHGGVTITDMIQTDASINPGNSGGPLLNSQGKLIGLATLIFSRSGSSAGIGFAVPSNTIKRIVGQIINKGRVVRPGLGIQVLDSRISRQLNIPGVIVGSVKPGGPAANAGLLGTYRDSYGQLQLGDIILRINKKRVKNYDDLYNIFQKIAIGEKVKVEYLRHGQKKTVMITTIDVAKK